MATVAEQWYQVADSAKAQIIQLTGQLAALEEQIRTGQGNRFALTGQRASIIRQIQELEKTESDARQNGFKALEAEKSGATVEPPAGSSTDANSNGNNTDVAVNSNDGTGGFSGTTIADSDATTISVSNGITTKTQEFANTAVTPDNDPFERERLNAERDSDSQLSGQDITDVDPVDDPFERERLNAERDIENDLAPEVVITASRIPKRDPAPQEPPPPADWRVRISIAKGSNYFYNDSDPGSILLPLKATEGVIFPYTPTISVSYSAQYDQQTLPHSNFKSTNYGSSSVDSVTVGGDFTAQDVNEANYLLAVIHFFRSATKMFYGKDENPNAGVPPPLLYLSGLGQYQFDNHPMVLQSFNYALPNDVDYINAYPGGAATSFDGTPLAPFSKPAAPKPNVIVGGINRLLGVGLKPGGTAKPPVFITPPVGNNNATRVPTKISISLTFLPVVTRRAISNEFSLKKYASGQLLRGSVNPGTGGGIW
jgi:hypothetical protein